MLRITVYTVYCPGAATIHSISNRPKKDFLSSLQPEEYLSIGMCAGLGKDDSKIQHNIFYFRSNLNVTRPEDSDIAAGKWNIQ